MTLIFYTRVDLDLSYTRSVGQGHTVTAYDIHEFEVMIKVKAQAQSQIPY